MQIILQPVLFEPYKDILYSLEKVLLKEFNASSSIVVAPPIKQIPEALLEFAADTELKLEAFSALEFEKIHCNSPVRFTIYAHIFHSELAL